MWNIFNRRCKEDWRHFACLVNIDASTIQRPLSDEDEDKDGDDENDEDDEDEDEDEDEDKDTLQQQQH